MKEVFPLEKERVILYFDKGLQPCVGYWKQGNKGFFNRKKVIKWFNDSGSELYFPLIIGWADIPKMTSSKLKP
jgi:hypothetical protein